MEGAKLTAGFDCERQVVLGESVVLGFARFAAHSLHDGAWRAGIQWTRLWRNPSGSSQGFDFTQRPIALADRLGSSAEPIGNGCVPARYSPR
jgi:hypothetical protein